MNTKIITRAGTAATIAFFASVKYDLFRNLRRIVLLVTLAVIMLVMTLMMMLGLLITILLNLN